MLDLKACVHLHKIKRLVLVKHELHCPCSHVSHCTRGIDSSRPHFFSQGFRHHRSRGFFQHFLVATLHTAVALVEVHDVAVFVRKDLELDMPRFDQVPLDQHALVTERFQGLPLARFQVFKERRGLGDNPHPLATPSHDRFEQHWVSHLVGLALQPRCTLVFAVIPWRARHASGRHDVFGGRFRTHGFNGRHGRAYELDPVRGQLAGKVCRLAEEAVPFFVEWQWLQLQL
jgi:hypothetical protein